MQTRKGTSLRPTNIFSPYTHLLLTIWPLRSEIVILWTHSRINRKDLNVNHFNPDVSFGQPSIVVTSLLQWALKLHGLWTKHLSIECCIRREGFNWCFGNEINYKKTIYQSRTLWFNTTALDMVLKLVVCGNYCCINKSQFYLYLLYLLVLTKH